jgi:hypothetical protein
MCKLSASKPNGNGGEFPWRKYAVLAVVSVCAVVAVAQSSPNEPLPAGPAKEKAETACSACHEARIIVQQRLSKAAWTKELDKMVKWGAEVDAKDRDALIDYFTANFSSDQPEYVAPRTAIESGSRAKTKRK